MATLDQLNFEVIINEKDFDEQVKRIQAKADELNTSITTILGANKKIAPFSDADVQNVRNVAKAYKDIAAAEADAAKKASSVNSKQRVDNARAEAEEIKKAAQARGVEQREVLKTQIAQERLNKLQKESNSILGRSSRLWREMGTMAAAYFSVHGAIGLLRTLTRITGEFEMQKVTLGAILNDTEAAGKIFEQIKALAVQSPFQFKELVTYTKQLSAFSVPVGELYETTKMLADVSAGLGVGMDRLVLAYGQIRSASFLRGQEVRQLTEAGIPILEELRKQFVELGEEGITVGDVFDKISKRMVPFEMVEKVFKNMTEEGGKFYKMQEVQAGTLQGKISNLTDAYQIMFAEIGDKKSGLLKGAVDMARSLAENYEKVGRTILSLVAAFGAYKVALTAIPALQLAIRAGHIQQIGTLGGLLKVLEKNIAATKAWKALMLALKNPVVLLGAAATATFVGISAAMISSQVHAAKFRRELDGIAQSERETSRKAVDGFQDLVKELRNATVGSQNYRDAISKLNNQYGEYLPNLLNEKNALYEIEKAEVAVTNAIYARGRAYAETQGLAAIDKEFGAAERDAGSDIVNTLGSMGIGAKAADAFLSKFRAAVLGKEGEFTDVFKETFQEYFDGSDLYNDLLRLSGKTWISLQNDIKGYSEAVNGAAVANERLTRAINGQFGAASFDTEEERQYLEDIERRYKEEENRIKDQTISSEETESQLLDLRKKKLQEIVNLYENMAYTADQMGKTGEWDNKLKEAKANLKALEGGEESWLQRIANPLAVGSNKDLAADVTDTLSEYADRLRKEYKGVTDSLTDVTDAYNNLIEKQKQEGNLDEQLLAKAKGDKDFLEARKATIEGIAQTVGFSINEKVKSSSRSSASSGKSEEQEDLEIRISTLKDVYKWYQKMLDLGMDKETVRDLLTNYFPDEGEVIEGERYKEVLLGLADALEQYSDKAAQALRDDIGVSGLEADVEKWKRAKDAAESYLEYLNDLNGMTPKNDALEQVVKDYQDNLEKINEIKANAMAELQTMWEGGKLTLGEYIEKSDQLDTASKAAAERALADAQEKAKDAIRAIYKEWKDGYEQFGNLSDMTLTQVKKFSEALSNWDLSSLTPEQQEAVKSLISDLTVVNNMFNEIKKDDVEATDEANKDKNITAWKLLAKNIVKAADALEEFGEASNNMKIAGLANYISFMGDIVSNTLDGFKKGDVLGGVIAAASTIADYVLKAATESARLKAELAEIAHERYLSEIEDRLKATETIFGDSWIGKIRVLRSDIRGLSKEIGDLVDKGEWLYRPYTPATSFLDALKEFANDLGMSLYKENGLFDTSTLTAILKNNKYALGKANREAIDLIIKDTEELEELYKDLDNSIKSMFSSLGSDIADTLIETLKATGDAATDLEDVFQNLGDSIFKSMVQSFVIDEVLNKYKDEVMSWWTDETLTEADIATRIRAFAESVKQDIELADDRITAMYDAFMSNSLLTVADEAKEKSTLGGGVKSITEDTANLLASYINAIRADVAAIRQSVAAEGAMNLPTPTLAEYLTQIQANTYNNAVAAQAILENLQSMMTMSDGPALRVFM